MNYKLSVSLSLLNLKPTTYYILYNYLDTQLKTIYKQHKLQIFHIPPKKFMVIFYKNGRQIGRHFQSNFQT